MDEEEFMMRIDFFREEIMHGMLGDRFQENLDNLCVMWNHAAANRINQAIAPVSARPVDDSRVFILLSVRLGNFFVLNRDRTYRMWYGW